MTTAVFHVAGMTCHHCVRAVTEEVGAIAGVESVDVALVAGGVSTVTVLSRHPISDDDVAAAVAEAGYTLARDP